MQKIRRILSIDGGGTRGIIPATILASIEEQTGKPIAQLFDLIAGTSTGAILALGLTKPNQLGDPEYSAQQICEVYQRDIPQIFRNPQSWWGNLLTPKYKSHAFQEVLQNSFAGCRLKAALTDVLIPCFDIEHRLPFMFNSRLARMRAENDFAMKDVALAASASPTVFHPVRIPRVSSSGRFVSLVDGGVFANNPSINALAEIKSQHPGSDEKYFMLSLGTGNSTRPLSDEFLSLWGYVHWSRPMLELVMESISESVHEQMQHLLPAAENQQYYRLQVELSTHSSHALDNASKANMQELSQCAKDFCSDSRELRTVSETLLRLSKQRTEPASFTH